MQVFLASINQMFVLCVFMVMGYFANHYNIIPLNTQIAISKLETSILVPCLVFNTFYKNCTIENLSERWIYIAYSGAIITASIIIGLLLSKFFTKDEYLRKIYSYSFTVANYGFMGNAVVLGVFGEKVLFDYMIFNLPTNIYVYSYGANSLIPKEKNKNSRFTFKKFLNPVFVAMFIGGIIGIIGLPLPQFLTTAISSAGNCMSPLAMFLTGFVVANYKFKNLVGSKKIYIASILRLVIIPLVFAITLKFLGTNNRIIMLVLCATAMPMGLNTIVFPAAYNGDTTPGASMVLISNLMAIITIPLMFIIFI